MNALDLAEVRRRLNRSAGDDVTGGGAYSPFADADGSGRINALDLAAVRIALSSALPPPPPLLPLPQRYTDAFEDEWQGWSNEPWLVSDN